jgi:hypothetical protein
LRQFTQWSGDEDGGHEIILVPFRPDLTGFIMANVDRTSMYGTGIGYSRFCGNLSGLYFT